MRDGQEIVFEGAGDQRPGTVPGDVCFRLSCAPHDAFVRRGDDLYAVFGLAMGWAEWWLVVHVGA